MVVSPNWWWSAPALLKGYIDRVFLPGFAMRYHEHFPYVGTPAPRAVTRVIAPRTRRDWRACCAGATCSGRSWIKRAVLRHCGFSPVRRMVLYHARHASDHDRNRFVDNVRELGRLGR